MANQMQSALAFLQSQATHLESQAYEMKRPNIQYPALIPVVTDIYEWAPSVTYYSMDMTGTPEWLNNMGTDFAMAETQKAQHVVPIHMASIGYMYNMEELGVARMIPYQTLQADKAKAARRAYEEFVDRIVLYGDSEKGWDGLLNNSNIETVDAADGATSESGNAKKYWANKTAEEILKDVNDILSGVNSSSNGAEMADTLCMSISLWNLIATKPYRDTTIMGFLREYNTYTAKTQRPLSIMQIRGLEGSGSAGDGKLLAYTRDPEVLRLILPMPHRFLEPMQVGLNFVVPGIFRLGGLEIRRPGACRYLDHVEAQTLT